MWRQMINCNIVECDLNQPIQSINFFKTIWLLSSIQILYVVWDKIFVIVARFMFGTYCLFVQYGVQQNGKYFSGNRPLMAILVCTKEHEWNSKGQHWQSYTGLQVLTDMTPMRAWGVKSRMCPPYPQRDRKRRLNGAVCRNHRIKRVVPCRC